MVSDLKKAQAGEGFCEGRLVIMASETKIDMSRCVTRAMATTQPGSLLTLKTYRSHQAQGLPTPDRIILIHRPSIAQAFTAHYYHLDGQSIRSLVASHQVDLAVSPEPRAINSVTSIELVIGLDHPASPSLIYGTSAGQLYLTRPSFSQPPQAFRQLHRSSVISLTSSKLEGEHTILISGASTELLLWDLTRTPGRPVCLRAFGRQSSPVNPYAPLLTRLECWRSLGGQDRVVAEFEDGLVTHWDLHALIDSSSTPAQPDILIGHQPESRPILAVCCTADRPVDYHAYSIDAKDGSVILFDNGKRLVQLPGLISRLVCVKCNHLAQHTEMLALMSESQELLKFSIDDGLADEMSKLTTKCIESGCTFFHYDRSEGLLATQSSNGQEPTVRRIAEPPRLILTTNPIAIKSKPMYVPVDGMSKFLSIEAITGKEDVRLGDKQLLRLLGDELDRNLKFPSHLRLAIYQRMLIKSKADEEEIDTEYYRLLSCPSPEMFLRRFRAAWKLEEASLQFSLETLLTIFHGMELYSDEHLIDRLAPVLYSFLKILDGSGREDESVELVEIFKVCRVMLERYGSGAFGESKKGDWEQFVKRVRDRLCEGTDGKLVVGHLDRHRVSFGNECLRSLTHGFFMGFTSPECFVSLMDHLVIGSASIDSIVELSARLIEYFCQELVKRSNRKEILTFFEETHFVEVRRIRGGQ